MTDPQELKRKIRELIGILRTIEGWPARLKEKISAWWHGVPEPPADDGKENLADQIFTALKREFRDLEQKIIRDAIVVFRGKLTVVDYAAIELTPEAIGARTLALGAMIERRLTEIKTRLKNPDAVAMLTLEEKLALRQEIALYNSASVYSNYPATERFVGVLTDVMITI